MSRFSKLLAALAGTVAIVADAMLDGVFVSTEIEAVVLSLVSAYFVYRLPNAPPAPPST